MLKKLCSSYRNLYRMLCIWLLQSKIKSMILRAKDKERLTEIFNTVTIPVEVWAYGSRVNGDAHDGSDLDLVIRSLNAEKIPYSIISALKEKIQKSNIPILVDLSDWSKLPENFQNNILQKHEMLFSNAGYTLNESAIQYSEINKNNSTGYQ